MLGRSADGVSFAYGKMKEILFSNQDQIVRHTCREDLPRIEAIYDAARERMHTTGNPTQWINHPKISLIESDMAAGKSYVIEQDGEVCGVFYFAVEDDETYHELHDGAWLNDEPYCVIHRIAGDGIHRGILQTAVAFALTLCRNVRIDTHANNTPMQRALPKLGFVKCGKIYIHDEYSDHSPRDAFHLAVNE